MEASAGVQEDAQALESLPVLGLVSCEQMMVLVITFFLIRGTVEVLNKSLAISIRQSQRHVFLHLIMLFVLVNFSLKT